MIEGIDVSHYQGKIDWARVAASGRRFAVVKATEHTSLDPMFKTNWSAIAQAGLLRAAYHFCHAGSDAVAQATAFVRAVRPMPTDLLVADFEAQSVDGQSRSECEKWLSAFLVEVGVQSGFLPVFYTSPLWFDGAVPDPGGFTPWPLWVADYRANAPRVPKGFKTWALWQYSSSATVPGVEGRCDVDRFNGDEAALTAFFHRTKQPPVASPVTIQHTLNGKPVATMDFPTKLDESGKGSIGPAEGLHIPLDKFLAVTGFAVHDPNAEPAPGQTHDVDYIGCDAYWRPEGDHVRIELIVDDVKLAGATVVPRILVAD